MITLTECNIPRELTAEEAAWAIRFFTACGQMSDGARLACMTFVNVAEVMAEQAPLHSAARLRLIKGSAH